MLRMKKVDNMDVLISQINTAKSIYSTFFNSGQSPERLLTVSIGW